MLCFYLFVCFRFNQKFFLSQSELFFFSFSIRTIRTLSLFLNQNYQNYQKFSFFSHQIEKNRKEFLLILFILLSFMFQSELSFLFLNQN